MRKVNLERLPENLTVRVLKAWNELTGKFAEEGFLKEQYKTWISRSFKRIIDIPRRYLLKRSIYSLYGLNSKEKKQANSLMRVYGAGEYGACMATA